MTPYTQAQHIRTTVWWSRSNIYFLQFDILAYVRLCHATGHVRLLFDISSAFCIKLRQHSL